ncbi:MAG: PmoA family protein [Bacteroidota bacterium]
MSPTIGEYIPSDSAYLFFLNEAIPAGSSLQILGESSASAPAKSIRWEQTDSTLTAISDGPILRFASAILTPTEDLPAYYARGGFLHPVYSPSGKVITDDFPAGHSHQHGIFFAWTRSYLGGEEMDFWNQHKQTADVRFEGMNQVEEFHQLLRLTSSQTYLSMKKGPVLEEVLSLQVYPNPSFHMWDIEVFQTNISSDTLHIDKYTYGGLGVRGSKYWNHEDSVHFEADALFLTSEGKDRRDANHTRPEWTAIYGPIDSDTLGLAVFDHPENSRYPQPARVHPEMPYFSISPQVPGSFSIPPDATYRMKFRMVSFDGMPDKDLLNKIGEVWSTSPIILTIND